MASSIKTVLDLDISKFKSSAAEAVSVAGKTIGAGLNDTITKKFGLKDAMRGLFQGLGLGGVDAIASAVVAPFKSGAEHAKALAALTADIYQNTLRWVGAIGGPTRELDLQVKQVAEMNRDIAMQRQLVQDLNANPINLLTEEGRNTIRDAESGLMDLIKKQAELATTVEIAALQENRRTEALQRSGVHAAALAKLELMHAAEGRKFDEKRLALRKEFEVLQKQGALPSVLQANLNAQRALNDEEAIANRNRREKIDDTIRAARAQRSAVELELRGASDMEKAQLRLNILRAEGAVIIKRNGILSPEAFENRSAQIGVRDEMRLIQKKARDDERGVICDLGGRLSGGTKGRRTERERIADRGVDLQRQADEAIRTGQSPEYVARLTRASGVDLASVGGKVATSIRKLSGDDSAGLSGKFNTANEHLKRISQHLEPRPIDE